MFVLNEKNISCNRYEVDLSNGEQCSNWFMQMNPKMDVPVLQNESLIVPSSSQIINYLEADFIGTDVPLLPTDDRHLLRKIEFLNRKISQNNIILVLLAWERFCTRTLFHLQSCLLLGHCEQVSYASYQQMVKS